ncbi:MAG TPA: hypothetical protein VKY92_00445 [Verrucomicrobiae bacterium]|nr:hypothetical protein [Verrucomicrobiae bacterium]
MIRKLIFGLFGMSVGLQVSMAQPFVYKDNDLLLGFRKTGTFQANYELVINIGQGTNYTHLAPGASIAVPNFTPSQLGDAFPNTNLNNLNWSVLGNPKVSLTGYPASTLWISVPRTNASVQSAPPSRLYKSLQQQTSTQIASIFAGAAVISSTIGTSNLDNTATFVREPINNDSDLTAFIGSQQDSTASTLHDTWPQNVEINTGTTLPGPVRSDLYEVRPIGSVDPHTGLTNGAAYFVGYFQLQADGTMTFTRASTNSIPPGPPPAPSLSLSRTVGGPSISFMTTNGATYSLYYTNSAGLSAPLSKWSMFSQTISGDGLIHAFTNATADSDRFYRVIAH